MMNLHFVCLESGVEQSSSARYNMVTDKQEVITLRFGNRTVRNDEISLLFQNAASINCYSSECKNTVISGHTHTQTLEKVLCLSEDLAPMQINFLKVLHLF